MLVLAERQALLDPLIISWGWQAERPGPSPFIDHFGWAGTDDPSAFLTVPAAIAFQREHHWPRVRAACHELLRETRARIGALTGLLQIAPDSPEWYGQLASIPLPQTIEPRQLHDRLWDEYRVEVPCTAHKGQVFVRVSIQAYNDREDVDQLIRGLREILGLG